MMATTTIRQNPHHCENWYQSRSLANSQKLKTRCPILTIDSTVKLGKLGYITMSPNTTLSLSFDEKTISGNLSAGSINVFNADGVEVKIQNFNNALAVPMNNRKDDDDKGVLGGSAVGRL